MTLTQVRALSDDAAFCDAFSRESVLIESRRYVIVDAYTHAPITPYAPIAGRMGIRADIKRDMPGMDALPIGDVSPERRRAFADTIEGLAQIESRVSAMRWERSNAPELSPAMRDSLRERANRAAEESDRLSDRAFYVRRAIGSAE